MPDRFDLDQITRLHEESQLMQAALGNIEAGGVITQMTLSGGPVGQPTPPGPVFTAPRMSVTIPTLSIAYPGGMLDAIKGAISTRIEQINAELATLLGVTNVAGQAARRS